MKKKIHRRIYTYDSIGEDKIRQNKTIPSNTFYRLVKCGENMKICKTIVNMIVVFCRIQSIARDENWEKLSKDLTGSILS